MLNRLVVYLQSLRKLMGIARTISESLDNLSPARSSPSSREQIPEQAFQVLLTKGRDRGVTLGSGSEEGSSTKELL